MRWMVPEPFPASQHKSFRGFRVSREKESTEVSQEKKSGRTWSDPRFMELCNMYACKKDVWKNNH